MIVLRLFFRFMFLVWNDVSMNNVSSWICYFRNMVGFVFLVFGFLILGMFMVLVRFVVFGFLGEELILYCILFLGLRFIVLFVFVILGVVIICFFFFIFLWWVWWLVCDDWIDEGYLYFLMVGELNVDLIN